MAAIRFYFDKRRERKDGKFPLKISVTHQKKYTLINTEIYLSLDQWDERKEKVVNHPNKAYLNTYLKKLLLDIETNLYGLKDSGKLSGLNGKQIKNKVLQLEDDKILFVEHFKQFAESKTNLRTKGIYLYTYSKIILFAGSNALSLRFEDVNYNWLKDFEKFLEKTSETNSRSIHFRNIRAVFNDALNRELTAFYPFRKFKIKSEKTAKRSLLVQDLVMLRDYNVEDHQRQYRDIFMLIFYLRGINTIDLCHLTHNSLRNGRLEYYRAKTKKFYSVKVEPEATEIIERYKGKNYLLNMLDRYKNYKDFCHRLNENLQQIGNVEVNGRGGKKVRTPLFPQITSYWARHTWATVAANIDIPKETIAAGLGHGGDSVTDIYIDFDIKKVDEANRKILDYLKV